MTNSTSKVKPFFQRRAILAGPHSFNFEDSLRVKTWFRSGLDPRVTVRVRVHWDG